jgi:hypothetical protein
MAPEINVTEKDVFGTFDKFQGFIEDIYQCTVDITLNGGVAENNWNFGLDEGVMTDTRMMSSYFEKGDYWKWQNGNYSPYSGTVRSPRGNEANTDRGYWNSGWYGIRKANMAIQNIGLLADDGSQRAKQEHDVLLGQAYFFRAYLHFEILRHWGHIAYIDTVYNASDVIEPNPLPYQECAAKIDQDLKKAAQLLPANWDTITFVPGQATASKNGVRVTKGSAYAIMGMNALYAGSPLMATDATRPNNPDSTYFDAEWMKKSAEAYGEVLKLSKLPGIAGATGQGGYDLEKWQDYHYNFWSLDGRSMTGKEVIWTYPNTRTKRWCYGDFYIDAFAWGTFLGPTQNYVENFGMVNGLPLADPASGYNSADPWKNRDPRFYYNIMYDGQKIIVNPKASWANYEYVQFFMGGLSRSSNCSLTGYGYHKFYGITCNPSDNLWGPLIYDVPLVRLAGVLLEYAEAMNEAFGPNGGKSATYPLTAVEAVNIVRARVMCPPYTNSYPELYDVQKGGTPLPPVDAKYTASKELYRETIRKERAVELAFEGKRFNDARRWGVASSLKYREKYELQFDKDHTYFKICCIRPVSSNRNIGGCRSRPNRLPSILHLNKIQAGNNCELI